MRNKRWFKNFAGLLAGAMVLGLLAGCGASGEKYSDAYYASNSAMQGVSSAGGSGAYKGDGMWSEGYDDAYTAEEAVKAPAADSGSEAGKVSESANAKRKLIKTVNMSVETQEYDSLMLSLEARIKELGGYIQKLESNNGSSYSGNRSSRNANLTVRIPQANLDAFVGSISELANITRRSESVDDITLSYVDLQSHKESLQVEQKRLLELLERAEYLEDIITLENRLTSVRYQIESMESQLRTYDDQVDYSTVYLGITEVKVYTPVSEDEPSTWERMTKGFLESLTNIKEGMVNFSVWFVVKSPYLVIWGVIIAVVVIVLRKRKIRKKGLSEKPKKTKGKKVEQKVEQESDEKDGRPEAELSDAAPKPEAEERKEAQSQE